MNSLEREILERPTRAPITTTTEDSMKITIHEDGTYTTGEPFGPATPSRRPTVAERIAARRQLDSDYHRGAISHDEYWSRRDQDRRTA